MLYTTRGGRDKPTYSLSIGILKIQFACYTQLNEEQSYRLGYCLLGF